MPRPDRREPRHIDGQLAAALTPATAQASSIPCTVCPITGPGARQMAESRDRCTPIPGPVRPMRRITAGISEAWTTPQRGHPQIHRLLGDLPAADASPAGRRTTNRRPRSRAPPRSRRSDQYGWPPARPRATRPPAHNGGSACVIHSLCCPVGGRPASPRKSHSKSQPEATRGDAEPLLGQVKCTVSPVQPRLAMRGR